MVPGALLNLCLRTYGRLSAICYICAMISKALAGFVLLLALPQAQQAARGQASANHPVPQPSSSLSSSTPAATPPATGTPAGSPNCVGTNCDDQPAHITVATAAPAAAPWTLPERIVWATNVLLVILGYGGILVAISTLKKIERQSRYAEAAAQAAADSAEAALLHAKAIVSAERPWVLVTIVPSRSIENGFTVIATNRGRSPAQVVSAAEETRITIDETHLPATPEYKPADQESPFVSIILLPGEFMNIKSFCREDVTALCGSEESLKRVENWEERIFLYGKVVYRDLMGPPSEPAHETGWCCRYIHGRQKSGLVMAGTLEYNLHT